jgi:cytochrome c-type biogenesis protein
MISFALAAGMLATVNPCGLTLLPAYLAMVVIDDAARGAAGRLTARRLAALRALVLSAAVTVGFAGTSALFGLALGPVADAVLPVLPYVGIGWGLLLVVLGGRLVAGRPAPAALRSVPGLLGFGAAYATASLGCTIAPFLAVVVAAVRAGATAQGMALFLAYAAGVGLVVAVAALAAVLVRLARPGRWRPPVLSVAADPDAPAPRPGARPSRLAGLLLMPSGGHVAWYGWYELRLRDGRVPQDPVIAFGDRAQQAASTLLDAIGGPRLAVTLLVLLTLVVVTGTVQRRRA